MKSPDCNYAARSEAVGLILVELNLEFIALAMVTQQPNTPVRALEGCRPAETRLGFSYQEPEEILPLFLDFLEFRQTNCIAGQVHLILHRL